MAPRPLSLPPWRPMLHFQDSKSQAWMVPVPRARDMVCLHSPHERVVVIGVWCSQVCLFSVQTGKPLVTVGNWETQARPQKHRDLNPGPE